MFKIEKSNYVQKQWGNELHLVNNDLYCGKILTVNKDKYPSLHCHMTKDETFYILKGQFEVQLLQGVVVSETYAKPIKNAKIQILNLKEGDSLRLNPGIFHRFIAKGFENIIIETSTKDLANDNLRLDPTYPNGCLNIDELNLKIEKYK